MIEVIDSDIQIAEAASALYNDRLEFTKKIIGATPSQQQAEGLILFDTEDHLSIGSGCGCGKDAMTAWNVIHYMSCRPFPKIPCTAPSKHQLNDVLWAEINKWYRQMNPIFRSMFRWTKESFYHVEHPQEWFAVARTATKDNPEALQGFHAEFVMRVIDEASGVPEPIFEVADGATGTVETKELMIANPTKLEGAFFRSHHQDKDQYATLTWSCLNSTIAPPRAVEKIRRKYGEDSNMWRVRVLGLFPLRDGDSFIPYDLAVAAKDREIMTQKDQPMVIGVDPARYGSDDTCICLRRGDDVSPIISLHGKSNVEIARFVGNLHNQQTPKPRMIYVDVIGVGAGVFDILEDAGFPVMAVNVAENPAYDGVVYHRLRDELWGNARTWLESRRGRIRDNSEYDFIGQITTAKYKINSKGRIVIESKDDMKKRGVDSPNMADAFNLTFAQPMIEVSEGDNYEDIDLQGGIAMPEIIDRDAGY